MNTTVCEGNTATFTCVIFYPSGTFATAPLWSRNGVPINAVNMPHHNIVDNLTDPNPPVYASSTLTISGTNTTFDDEILYQCGISVTISNTAILNVAGTLIYILICLYVNTYVALVIKTITILIHVQ